MPLHTPFLLWICGTLLTETRISGERYLGVIWNGKGVSISTHLLSSFHKGARLFSPAALYNVATLASTRWVAIPGTTRRAGSSPALHVASSCHVTGAAYSCEGGRRITQLHRFFLAQKDYFADWGGARGDELPRIPIPRPPVNKGKRKGRST
jgi:hypothetical protein